MSRTSRRVPYYMRGCTEAFKERAKRGLEPTERTDVVGNVVWSQSGKRALKKRKKRAARGKLYKTPVALRELKKLGYEVVDLKLAHLEEKDLLGFPTLIK